MSRTPCALPVLAVAAPDATYFQCNQHPSLALSPIPICSPTPPVLPVSPSQTLDTCLSNSFRHGMLWLCTPAYQTQHLFTALLGVAFKRTMLSMLCDAAGAGAAFAGLYVTLDI